MGVIGFWVPVMVISVPWAASEIISAIITLFLGRIIVAFVAAESASYLQATY